MTRFLLLISMCILLACGKKHTVPSNYIIQPVKSNTDQVLLRFVQVEKDSLQTYATAIDTYGKYFSGVTYFKNTQDTAMRVLFTTHTGLKLLDMQLNADGCSTVYAVEQLQNPIVLNLLCHDFGLISSFQEKIRAHEVYENQFSDKILVQKGQKDLYFYTTASGALTQLFETVPGKKKIQTEALASKEDSSIVVKHRNFNFKLTLDKLTLD